MGIDGRAEWLKARLDGIGASEAAAVMGCSPYMNNVELWEIKTRRKAQEDISEKSYVKYGVEAEEHLRALFALDFPEYDVTYSQFAMLRNNSECPFAFATLDGELVEKASGRRGVLEIKTTEILAAGQWERWNGRLPDHYYVQILHQLLATGYGFVILKAQIKQRRDDETTLTTRHYRIEREEVMQELTILARAERKFWVCVREDRRPPLRLPEI